MIRKKEYNMKIVSDINKEKLDNIIIYELANFLIQVLPEDVLKELIK